MATKAHGRKAARSRGRKRFSRGRARADRFDGVAGHPGPAVGHAAGSQHRADVAAASAMKMAAPEGVPGSQRIYTAAEAEKMVLDALAAERAAVERLGREAMPRVLAPGEFGQLNVGAGFGAAVDLTTVFAQSVRVQGRIDGKAMMLRIEVDSALGNDGIRLGKVTVSEILNENI